MAGKYNTWLRTKLADRIRRNGGYVRGYHDRYALVWMVRVYNIGIDDAEEARAALIEHKHFANEVDLTLQFPDFDEWYAKEIGDGQNMYDYATECLQDSLSNDEGLRMWSPKTADRYGFAYMGEGADKPFDMELAGVSSGGKRIALCRFDGENLELDNNELADAIDPEVEHDYNWDRQYTNSWCRKLMGIMDELDEALTEENAKRCGRYYATDYIARELGLFD